MTRVVETDTDTDGDELLAFEVSGTGPHLVLIHGLGGSRRWWVPTLEQLAERYSVLGLDLAGFGASRGRSFGLRSAAGHVERLLEARGVEQAAVLGHSMGGLVAARLAARAPRRVERLVLVDAPLLPFGWGLPRHALNMLRAARYVPPKYIRLLATDLLRAGPRSLALGVRGILGADLTADLARIAAPCLLVWGERDPLVPVGVGWRAAGLIPDATLKVIPGTGHAPMWERPFEFVRVVTDFLNEGPASS
jgi:pimeloyl-ACP methyl ester carboxylesterase